MAPVKPMGVNTPPKGSKPGVTGFVQDYNDTPSPSQDLNPDAVTEDSVLPPRQANAPKATGARKGGRKGARKGAAKK
jgi:hypothetical protein